MSSLRERIEISSRFCLACRKAWAWLVTSHPSITDHMMISKSRLLASLLVIIIPLGSLSAVIQLLTVPGFLATFGAIFAGVALLAIAYGLNRAGRYRFAAPIVIVAPAIASLASLYNNPGDFAAFSFLLISVLIGSIFMNVQFALGVAAFNCLALVLLPVVNPVWTFAMVSGGISINIILPLLIVFATYYNVRNERQQSDAIRRNENKYRSLFIGSLDGIFLCDPSGRIIDTNDAVDALLGYPAEALAEMSFTDLFASSAEAERFTHMLSQKGVIREYEVKLKKADGTVIICLITGSVPASDTGSHFGYHAFVRNITERKQAQQNLENLNIQLEQRVSERTAELAASNEKLTQLSRIKDDFISNVSHELRTPITNIKLYHLLIDKKPENLENYLGVLNRETYRLELVVEDLLNLSDITSKHLSLQPKPVDINEVLRTLVEDRQSLAEQQGLALFTNLSEQIPVIEADPILIVRAVHSIVTNALTYTPEGGRITVTSDQKFMNNRYWVVITVRDSGPGISGDELPHVFERFYRGRSALDSGTAGTGLGLAIAREIVEQHKGQIDVASAGIDGLGAEFTIMLPIKSRLDTHD